MRPFIQAQARDVASSAVAPRGDTPRESEDFGVFARHVPACFSFIGNGTLEGEGGTPLHSRSYDANDDVLAAGVAFYGAVVRAELAPLVAGSE